MAVGKELVVYSRLTDVLDEPVGDRRSPIGGYEEKPLVPLMETVKDISGLFTNIEENVSIALQNCRNPVDGLTPDESASIYLYTMQFRGGPSLYQLLNRSLRAEDREELIPWFSYLKLFLTALHKLPSVGERVWRGVRNLDLSGKYRNGEKFFWWGVSSCTTHIEVLESSNFLGKHGQRTLFSIDCVNEKSIAAHSFFQNREKEVLLMPGSYFEVISTANPAPDLHIIQLKEIPPPVPKRNISTRLLRVRTKIMSKMNASKVPNNEILIPFNKKWKQSGVTIAGGNSRGYQVDQLHLPEGICFDDQQNIYIADMENHRIVQWKCNASRGRVVAGGNGQGNQTNQLNCPADVIIDRIDGSLIIADQDNRRVMRWSYGNGNGNGNGKIVTADISCFGLAMDRDGSLYVSDREKNHVKRWKRGERTGTIVAGGNGKGDHLDQLNWPTFIFVDDDYSLYISDSWNHRVMKWIKDAKEGIIVAGGNRQGTSLRQMCYPSGITVDSSGRIYVADSGNHRVMCWFKGLLEGTIIIGEQPGNQLNSLRGLKFDGEENLYVVNQWNHRIQKFELDQPENDDSVLISL